MVLPMMVIDRRNLGSCGDRKGDETKISEIYICEAGSRYSTEYSPEISLIQGQGSYSVTFFPTGGDVGKKESIHSEIIYFLCYIGWQIRDGCIPEWMFIPSSCHRHPTIITALISLSKGEG